MRLFFALCFFIVDITCGYAWNGAGHKLVAQIAYDNLSPHAKSMCGQIFQIRERDLEVYFVTASTWLDDIRKRNVYQFAKLHYIDIPFTKDKSKLPKIKPRNALWAIKQAILVLSSNKSDKANKFLYLKILIHVVGDIHQPLHTATKVSRSFPKGDLGGNLYLFSKSPYGKNLHQYWDNGAGFLTNKSLQETKLSARILEKKFPCSQVKPQKPEAWINASHFIAVNQVYSLRTHKQPNSNYLSNTRLITQQQIALAGCRLASVLNGLAG